jgi:hypothetical protein
VAIPLPFHWTIELETNPVPAIVIVVSPAPAIAEEGAIDVIEGDGLRTFTGVVCPVDPLLPLQPAINNNPEVKKAEIESPIARLINPHESDRVPAFPENRRDGSFN